MSQNPRRHLPPSESTGGNPKELAKLEFGRRLMQLMLDRGWSQSDLARHAELGRDAISTYVRGRSFPEPRSLTALARALNVPASELMPQSVTSAIEADTTPMLEIKQAAGHPDRVFIRVNRVVTIEQAAAIFNIIRGEVK